MKPSTFFQVESVGRHPRRFDPTDGYRLQFCGGGSPIGPNRPSWEAAQEAAWQASCTVYVVERQIAQPGSTATPLVRWQCVDRNGFGQVMVIEETKR